MIKTVEIEQGSNGIAAGPLRAFVERVEHIEGEIKALNDDKSEIYKEIKGSGFDGKIIKKVVAIRRKDPQQHSEEEELLELYKTALGMA